MLAETGVAGGAQGSSPSKQIHPAFIIKSLAKCPAVFSAIALPETLDHGKQSPYKVVFTRRTMSLDLKSRL